MPHVPILLTVVCFDRHITLPLYPSSLLFLSLFLSLLLACMCPANTNMMAPNPYLNKYNETAEFGADLRNCRSKNSNPYASLKLQKLKQLGQRYGVTDLEKVKPGVGKERLAKFVEASYRREQHELAPRDTRNGLPIRLSSGQRRQT